MHSFVRTCIDILFPPSKHEKIVRETTFEMLKEACAPHVVGESTALASYHAPLVRACIHEAKFHHNTQAVTLLGTLLAAHLAVSLPKSHRNVHLIPIPLSAERLRERGYNQTYDIARSARACDPRIQVHETILHKTKHTRSQTSLTREARLKNLAGVFALGEHTLPHDVHLILFDDITTTGATLREAARALRAEGFTHVDQLALAH